jgi:hypothetical protein
VEWCPGAESNHRHCDFQSHALPTELPGPKTGRVRAACLAHPQPPINPLPHAACGDIGGSSSSSKGGPGIRYCSPSQRPKSTSAQRGEQNGRFAADDARPQIGQRGGALAINSLNTPTITGKRRVGARSQLLTRDSRKVRQRYLISLKCRDHPGCGAQCQTSPRLGA